MNLSKVLLVSDCLQLVNFVNGGKDMVDWRSCDILEDCRFSLSSCNNFKVMHITRLKNKVAICLARRARKYCLKTNWVSFPYFLSDVVRKEPIVNACNLLIS